MHGEQCLHDKPAGQKWLACDGVTFSGGVPEKKKGTASNPQGAVRKQSRRGFKKAEVQTVGLYNQKKPGGGKNKKAGRRKTSAKKTKPPRKKNQMTGGWKRFT